MSLKTEAVGLTDIIIGLLLVIVGGTLFLASTPSKTAGWDLPLLIVSIIVLIAGYYAIKCGLKEIPE